MTTSDDAIQDMILIRDCPRVTVLSGSAPTATAAVARTLLLADPSLLLIRHDLSSVRAGVVRRVVCTVAGPVEDERVTLAHGCAWCTLRDDVLPCLVRLATAHPERDIVLVLPEMVEPDAVAGACAVCTVDGRPVTDVVRFDSFVTVVDAATILADLDTMDGLADRGMQATDEDHRVIADLAVRQIEYADTVVRWGDAGGAYHAEQVSVLLHRLAPWARHITAGHASSMDGTELAALLRRPHPQPPDRPDVLARGIEGLSLGVDEPVADCGVVSALFTSRRPFHPQRLHDALGEVTGSLLRSRGHLWLASQPERVIGWEYAGGRLGVGSLGRWLAALPADRWQEASRRRRSTASAQWDPYYGDRHIHLALIGIGVEPDAIRARLTDCLLTDAELATGEETWRTLPDPFARLFDDTDDEAPVTSNGNRPEQNRPPGKDSVKPDQAQPQRSGD